jgi:hypothetical protein
MKGIFPTSLHIRCLRLCFEKAFTPSELELECLEGVAKIGVWLIGDNYLNWLKVKFTVVDVVML